MTTPTPTLPEALRQGHGIASEDGYFEARPQIDSMDRRKVFGAGFERGWEAALAAEPAQERIQALELEVRQLTEQIAGLRHAPTPQADSQPAQVLVYPPLPEPFIGVKNQPWVGHAEVIRSAIGEDGVIPCFTAGQMVAYADATHAARAQADSVLEDAALLHYALADGGNQSMNWQDIYEDWSGEGHLIDALRTAYRLDAARKQGGA